MICEYWREGQLNHLLGEVKLFLRDITEEEEKGRTLFKGNKNSLKK